MADYIVFSSDSPEGVRRHFCVEAACAQLSSQYGKLSIVHGGLITYACCVQAYSDVEAALSDFMSRHRDGGGNHG